MKFSLIIVFLLSFSIEAQIRTEYPTILHKMHLTDGTKNTYPVAPPHKTTNDGRVALDPQSGIHHLEFYLNAPEKFNKHIMRSVPGAGILATHKPVSINLMQSKIIPSGSMIEHATICDPTLYKNTQNNNNFPKICANNNNHDCYIFNVIYSLRLKDSSHQLRSVPIRVEVTKPKTKNAKIIKVTMHGSPKIGQTFHGISKFMELTVAGEDKRLLVMRTLNSTIRWRNTRTKKYYTQKRDIVYSTYNKNKSPCDVTGFREIHPITHAPYDTRINRKYDFARLKFRNIQGKRIADGAEIYGAYPWIDKLAKNLVILTSSKKLTNYSNGKMNSKYPFRCTYGKCKPTTAQEVSLFEERGRAKVYGMMGLWTAGKLVTFDSLINTADFALGMLPRHQVALKLYKPESGRGQGYIRIGGQRQNQKGDVRQNGYVDNISFFESYENVFNYIDTMKPRSPRDVVWQVSSGRVTDEISFDDFMNNNILIYSQMNPSAVLYNNYRYFYDGFQKNSSAFKQSNVRLQNSSTSTTMKLPPYGTIQGSARVEPVALGGIRGKGLYLNGKTSVNYKIPNINNHDNVPWTISYFLDPRISNNPKTFRELIKLPNNTRVYLKGRNKIRVKLEANKHKDFTLPSALTFTNKKWRHVAIKFFPRNRSRKRQKVELYIDGFLFHATQLSYKNKYLSMSSGDLKVGAKFKGWIDDIKVIRGAISYEEMCNHAYGSLIQLTSRHKGKYKSLTSAYPIGSRKVVSKALSRNSNKIACHTEYRNRLGINVNKPPYGTISLRDIAIFPEGPLLAHRERPDSSTNKFCLSCHTPNHPVSSMNTSALVFRNRTATHDFRRQPTQPNRKMYGNIPKNHFGFGLPNKHIRSNNFGTFIDQFLLR